MAITIIASTHTPGVGGGVPTTSAIDTTGATLLEVTVAFFGAATLTDSKSNTWTGLTAITASNTEVLRKFYAYSTGAGKTGTGHTFSVAGGFASTITVVAYAGTGLVFSAEATGATSASTSSIATGAVLPGNAPALVTASLGWDNVGTPTSLAVAGGALAIRETQPGVAGNSLGLSTADEVQAVATSRTATWSWSSGARPALVVAAAYAETPAVAGFNALLIQP